ncbi:imidazole glycerol phosphate synthase subunit HisH [Acidovorax sp. Root568]|uniref:imidazole glycerol phosphate synthase subunit HisH n=1 Tax=Acidovorax sp. Root568 TaxID=1736565 RepID=UPI0009E6B4EC|nr:imidazole glycerol phosphate synthase subunit HisH [Acidovorax sp. Root568]
MPQRVVTLVDLQIQNILSVTQALNLVGARVIVARDAAAIAQADLLVLPGVGSFAEASRRLFQSGLAEAIQHHALERQRPVVGFCLGMQLLGDSSQEHGEHPGLGLIPGQVVRLREKLPDHRVPNVGWRTVHLNEYSTAVLPAVLDGANFYHVHSYHFEVKSPSHCIGTSRFAEEDIASIVARGRVLGTQFHPEKSQEPGLDLLHALVCHFR